MRWLSGTGPSTPITAHPAREASGLFLVLLKFSAFVVKSYFFIKINLKLFLKRIAAVWFAMPQVIFSYPCVKIRAGCVSWRGEGPVLPYDLQVRLCGRSLRGGQGCHQHRSQGTVSRITISGRLRNLTKGTVRDLEGKKKWWKEFSGTFKHTL